MYLKDCSYEAPQGPRAEANWQPQINLDLATTSNAIQGDLREVVLTVTVSAKQNDKTLFLVEAKQAGIFEIRNIPQDQLQPIIGIACPGIVYPYLRGIVADVCTRAGFPPVTLSEVNFQAMFEAQQQQLAAQGNGATSVN